LYSNFFEKYLSALVQVHTNTSYLTSRTLEKSLTL